MRNIILVLGLLYISLTASAQWQSFEVIPWNNNGFITAVDFVDANTGCVGLYGMYRTTDAGETWVNVEPTVVAHDIKFFGQIGYATGASGTGLLLKSTDAGAHWAQLWTGLPYGTPFSKVSILDENTVLVVSNETPIRKLRITTDGGASWNIYFTTYEMYLVSGAIVNSINFAAGQDNFYVQVGSEWLLRSNGGLTCHSDIASINGSIFLGGQAGTNGAISVTSDQGINWQTVILNSSDQGICNELGFDGNIGYVAGSQFTNNSITGKIYRTEDGITWSEIYQRPNEEFLDLAITSQYIYFVGRGNNIVRLNPQLLGVDPEYGSIPNMFKLSQNYPNPFNPSTVITYSIPKQSMVRITVYDSNGKELETIVNGMKDEGKHEVLFNASYFSSGVYFYKLSAGDFTDTKKMILIK